MMYRRLLLLVAALPTIVISKTINLDGVDYNMIGDMVVPMDEIERGYVEARKYWINGSTPTILYTIDPERIVIENVLRKAFNEFEKRTCFKFVRVAPEDKRSKLYYFNGGVGTCWSFVGNLSQLNQKVSIGGGCDNLGIVTHETMHALGFPHTQCRTDRDKNIIILFQNMESTADYQISKNSLTYGTVYNFKSPMHYLNYFFGNNKGPTFVTRDPSYERYIKESEVMTQGEAYQLNKYYNCFDQLGQSCPNRECFNGGFIINDCTCFCPGNYTGAQCETYAGPWFVPDEYDRTLDEPGVIITKKYPFENPKINAKTWVRLPKCFSPRLLVLTNDMISDHYDSHTVRMETINYRSQSLFKVSPGSVMNGNGNELVFTQSTKHIKPGRGVEVAVDFIPDGSCGNRYTNFSQLVCMKEDLPGGSWIFQSPNYPERTDVGMACILDIPRGETPQKTYSVTLDYNLEEGERLDVTHGVDQELKLVGPAEATLKFVTVPGMSIMYKASVDKPGYFRFKADIQNAPQTCKTVTQVTDTITVNQPFTQAFPKSLYSRGAMCNMLFKTAQGRTLKITFDSISLKTDEFLTVYNDPSSREDFTKVTTLRDPIQVPSNEMLVTYASLKQANFSPFQFTVSVI